MPVGLSGPARPPTRAVNRSSWVCKNVGVSRISPRGGHLRSSSYTGGDPMDNLIFAVVALCARWLEPRHNAQIQFLQAQIRMLRARIPSERIIVSPRTGRNSSGSAASRPPRRSPVPRGEAGSTVLRASTTTTELIWGWTRTRRENVRLRVADEIVELPRLGRLHHRYEWSQSA
jgi:hypothetical protein